MGRSGLLAWKFQKLWVTEKKRLLMHVGEGGDYLAYVQQEQAGPLGPMFVYYVGIPAAKDLDHVPCFARIQADREEVHVHLISSTSAHSDL